MKSQSNVIFNFSNPEDQASWQIVNDGVMGGISESKAVYNSKSGNHISLAFQGIVSLENNGGFASLRTNVGSLDFSRFSGMQLQVRGDGKNYQLRLRMDRGFDGISYRHHLQTLPGTTQVITVSFADFQPVFRGRIIKSAPPLAADNIQQLGFLIADKQSGEFNLEIDWIKGVE